jgi:DNA-directed RNA polymerase alpha subunit
MANEQKFKLVLNEFARITIGMVQEKYDPFKVLKVLASIPRRRIRPIRSDRVTLNLLLTSLLNSDRPLLSVRTRNALRKLGIHYLGDLIQTPAEKLRNRHNKPKGFGDTSFEEVRKFLEERDLEFGMRLPPGVQKAYGHRKQEPLS